MTRPAHARGAGRSAYPLTPFVDRLPIPPRYVITEPTRLSVRVETAQHRFHRELPPSRVWTYDGHLPGRRSRSVGACRSRWRGRTASRAPCR
jgi:spore coat protein A, manganese oxidase